MTPEERALHIAITFPIANTHGEAEAMEALIAKHITEAIAEERKACAQFVIDDGWDHGDQIAAAIRARA
jgi:hypothetical protein